VTPEELTLIEEDWRAVGPVADTFARCFYDTLFEVAPELRSRFPYDLADQRAKLVAELVFLVETAIAARRSHGLEAFVDRARQLGRRHVGYGAAAGDYPMVGVALLAGLRVCVEGWDDVHEVAWTKLYRLIAEVMVEGASTVPRVDR
jgi:nitric oxide dioxygenase